MKSVQNITSDIGDCLISNVLPNEPSVYLKSKTIKSIISKASPAMVANQL